jgi:sulfite exporter TauE/SafE
MPVSSAKDIFGHVKRIAYACFGIGLSALGIFREMNDSDAVSASTHLVVIAGGLFFIYVGLLYYLPKNRRRRAELNSFLTEAENAEVEQEDLD